MSFKIKDMTKEQLEQMGIIPDGGKIKPNKYWINSVQENINIYETTTIEDIFEEIYRLGEQNGIKEDKRQRSNEFKALLDNDCEL